MQRMIWMTSTTASYNKTSRGGGGDIPLPPAFIGGQMCQLLLFASGLPGLLTVTLSLATRAQNTAISWKLLTPGFLSIAIFPRFQLAPVWTGSGCSTPRW